MYSEDNLLPLSALQHIMFCERQCALIHIEQVWEENRLTVEGRLLHERVHEQGGESRGDVRIARGVRLRSLRLGIAGIADVVEFHRGEDQGVPLPGARGLWRVFPVEYKRGRPKPDACDTVQLCAQALCLEEMLNANINDGAIFYGQPRRRLEVAFDAAPRTQCEQTVDRLHRLIAAGQTPPAVYEARCKRCSLLHSCMPRMSGGRRSAQTYLGNALRS